MSILQMAAQNSSFSAPEASGSSCNKQTDSHSLWVVYRFPFPSQPPKVNSLHDFLKIEIIQQFKLTIVAMDLCLHEIILVHKLAY